MNVLGMMSGTSVDGVDLVLADLHLEEGPAGRTLRSRVLAHRAVPFPPELRQAVLETLAGRATTSEVARVHHALGRFYAHAAAEFRGRADLAASHGQTVWHEPPGCTLQLGEPAYLAETLGVPVVSNFRAADLALGGEAAPLVPYPDLLLYGREGRRLAIHNIGGISNLTYLPGLDRAGVVAFDTGPGNVLLDEAAARLGLTHDAGGAIAASGAVDAALAERWLAHPYFDRPPPKSTGRETWRLEALDGHAALAPHDLLATLTHVTARSIVEAYRRFVTPLGLDEIWVAGGGAANATLVGQIRAGLDVPVRTFEEMGLDSKHREALCFAVLGYLRQRGLPNVIGRTTGARADAIAGTITLPAPPATGLQAAHGDPRPPDTRSDR